MTTVAVVDHAGRPVRDELLLKPAGVWPEVAAVSTGWGLLVGMAHRPGRSPARLAVADEPIPSTIPTSFTGRRASLGHTAEGKEFGYTPAIDAAVGVSGSSSRDRPADAYLRHLSSRPCADSCRSRVCHTWIATRGAVAPVSRECTYAVGVQSGGPPDRDRCGRMAMLVVSAVTTVRSTVTTVPVGYGIVAMFYIFFFVIPAGVVAAIASPLTLGRRRPARICCCGRSTVPTTPRIARSGPPGIGRLRPRLQPR